MSGGMAGIERLQYCPGYREATETEVNAHSQCSECANSMSHHSVSGMVIFNCKRIKGGNTRVGAGCICEKYIKN